MTAQRQCSIEWQHNGPGRCTYVARETVGGLLVSGVVHVVHVQGVNIGDVCGAVDRTCAVGVVDTTGHATGYERTSIKMRVYDCSYTG